VKPSRTIRPVFDDPNLVSAAGLVPALRLAESAGFRDLLGGLSVPAANAGAKAASVVGGMPSRLINGIAITPWPSRPSPSSRTGRSRTCLREVYGQRRPGRPRGDRVQRRPRHRRRRSDAHRPLGYRADPDHQRPRPDRNHRPTPRPPPTDTPGMVRRLGAAGVDRDQPTPHRHALTTQPATAQPRTEVETPARPAAYWRPHQHSQRRQPESATRNHPLGGSGLSAQP
jgi:hypothetical protein